MKKQNKGAALTIVLVLLVFISYASILIMSMSYSNLKISRSYNSDRRLYRGVDYVANIISVRLQKEVKKIQDDARNLVEVSLNSPAHLKSSYESYLTEKGTLNKQDYDYIFNKEYKPAFKTLFDNTEYANSSYTQTTREKLVTNGTTKDAQGYYKLTTLNTGENIYYKLTQAGYNSTTECITCVIDTKIEYTNEIRANSNFQNKTTSTIVFKINSSSEDFNIENYKIVNNKNEEIPIFTKNVALLAQNNIIFASGSDSPININGDVIAFGHVPQESSSNKAEREKANWQDYGGVIFGYSKKIGNHATNGDTRAKIFGTNWNSNSYIPATSDRISGNVTIDGNVATLGYVNVAKGDNGRNIRITGDTFARQFILSEDSHQTNVYLGYSNDAQNKLLGKGNLYVTDDLQVDSSFSKLVVYGDFYGISDKYTSVSGGSDTSSDWTNEKRTSTLNINGNSIVELRNKVYIGGTAFLSNIRTASNTEESGNNGYAYITGISGAKSSQISAEAYLYSDKNRYVYDKDGNTQTPNIGTAYYLLSQRINNSNNREMMSGYGSYIGDKFDQSRRAFHFKNYFNNNVASNFGLMGTMNFGNLRIKTDVNGKIQGWAQGVIIGAGVKDFTNILGTERINAYYDADFTEQAGEVFSNDTNPNRQRAIIQKFQSYMDAFLDNTGFGTGSKIVQTEVDKNLTDYINNVNQSSILNFIKNNPGIEYKNSTLGASVYYNRANSVNMSVSGSTLRLSDGSRTTNLTYKKGIIFVDGDIYIGDNVNFEGIIIATGNITISGGNVTITRNKDISDVSNDVVNKLREQDYSVKMFFGLQEYDIDDKNTVVQRINQDYVKIIKWTLV